GKPAIRESDDDAGMVRVPRKDQPMRHCPEPAVIGRQHDIAGLRDVGPERPAQLRVQTVRWLSQVRFFRVNGFFCADKGTDEQKWAKENAGHGEFQKAHIGRLETGIRLAATLRFILFVEFLGTAEFWNSGTEKTEDRVAPFSVCSRCCARSLWG